MFTLLLDDAPMLAGKPVPEELRPNDIWSRVDLQSPHYIAAASGNAPVSETWVSRLRGDSV